LERNGITLRLDSKLFKGFIQGTVGVFLEEVVGITKVAPTLFKRSLFHETRIHGKETSAKRFTTE